MSFDIERKQGLVYSLQRLNKPQINRAQSVSLNAEEAKINSWVLHICQINASALVHFHAEPPLVLLLHILLQQVNGVHDVQVVTIACNVPKEALKQSSKDATLGPMNSTCPLWHVKVLSIHVPHAAGSVIGDSTFNAVVQHCIRMLPIECTDVQLLHRNALFVATAAACP